MNYFTARDLFSIFIHLVLQGFGQHPPSATLLFTKRKFNPDRPDYQSVALYYQVN